MMMNIKSWMIEKKKNVNHAEAEAGGRSRRRAEQAEQAEGGGRMGDGDEY